MIVRVRALELGPSGALAHHHVVCLAAAFRLQRQQSPVGGRLASANLAQWLTSLDLRINSLVKLPGQLNGVPILRVQIVRALPIVIGGALAQSLSVIHAHKDGIAHLLSGALGQTGARLWAKHGRGGGGGGGGGGVKIGRAWHGGVSLFLFVKGRAQFSCD